MYVNWKLGAEIFNCLLYDDDKVSSSFSWQWIAGWGWDAATLLTLESSLCNPRFMWALLQAENFDTDRKFVNYFLNENYTPPVDFKQTR